MRVISKSTLIKYYSKHANIKKPLEDWHTKSKIADWKSLNDVQKTYSTAEAVENFTVFNIKGNKYRLIVSINYQHSTIYIKYILTHSEYDKDGWKNDPWFIRSSQIRKSTKTETSKKNNDRKRLRICTPRN